MYPIGEQRTNTSCQPKRKSGKNARRHTINTQPANNDARKRERRFAVARARHRQLLFLSGGAG